MTPEKQQPFIVLKREDTQEVLEIPVTEKQFKIISKSLGAWHVTSADKGR